MSQSKDKNIYKILSESYTEKSFGGAVGLLAVREDPARYITQTDKMGIYNMVLEILDNSLDEVIESQVLLSKDLPKGSIEPRHIKVTLNQETGDCMIADQGRGIPLSPAKNHPDLPTLNAVFERDNMGSKGNKSGIEVKGYSGTTIGTHGAGAFVVTACSEFMRIYTTRYNSENERLESYFTEYVKGVPVENPKYYMNRVYQYDKPLQDYTGTTVWFKPDTEIMKLFNPIKGEMEEDYYFEELIEQRISDTLETLGDESPVIVTLEVVGNPLKTFDSRELSIIHDLEENVDYCRVFIEPSPHIKTAMDEAGVSNFNLDLIIKKINRNERLRSKGFVNRIKVEASTHLTQIMNSIDSQLRIKAGRDKDLDGFFDKSAVYGIEVIPILNVELAQWDAQVKTKYTDYQVAHFLSREIGESGWLDKTPVLEFMDYCFETSKESLLLKKKERDKRRQLEKKMIEENEEKLKKEAMKRSAVDSISWLSYTDENLFYNGNVEDSTLFIFEGTSGNTGMEQIRQSLGNIAVFTGLTGKIDNLVTSKIEFPNASLVDMERERYPITPTHKLDALFKAPWKAIVPLTDNDSDGAHQRALIRLFTQKRYPHLLEEGKIFELSPDYCEYRTSEVLKYEFNGEEKVLSGSGTLRTDIEYNLVRTLFPGKIQFTLFKGVGSMSSDRLRAIITDKNLWFKVPPLTDREVFYLEEFFTLSSSLKVNYTLDRYGEGLRVKDKVKTMIYKDTIPKVNKLIEGDYVSDKPDFNRVSRCSLDDYLERGSALIEGEEIKRLLSENLDILY